MAAGTEDRGGLAPSESSTTTTRASVACVSCRHLKIRCIREAHTNELCENCLNSGRDCQFVPLSKTRRRKRADVRLNELEQKVLTLTAQLKQDTPPVEPVVDFNVLDADLQVQEDEDIAPYPEHDKRSDDGSAILPDDTSVPGGKKVVLDQDLLSWPDVVQLFDRYKTELVPCYPIVPLANEVDAMGYRRDHPVLFLAMITAAAATSSEQIQNLLYASIVKMFAKLIMIDGTKSLELLQALLITVAWYRPCSTFGGDTKYMQYSQFASLMAHELRLDLLSLEKVDNGYTEDDERSEIEIAAAQAEQISARRTLLASYLQSSSKELMSGANITAHPPVSVTTSLSYFEAKIYDYSMDDRCMFSYVRVQYTTQQALELLYNKNSFLDQFECDEDSVVSILTVYGKQLEDVIDLSRSSVCKSRDFLHIATYAAILRMHEVVLYRFFDARDFRAPFVLNTAPRSSSYNAQSAFIETIHKCILTAGKLLDTLSSLDLVLAAAMPPVIFVRMMYTFVVLYKIQQMVVSSPQALPAVIDAHGLDLPGQLQRMHRMLTDIDRHSSFQGVNKFLTFVTDMQSRVAALPL